MLFLFVWKKSDHKSRKSEKNPIIKLMFFFFVQIDTGTSMNSIFWAENITGRLNLMQTVNISAQLWQ